MGRWLLGILILAIISALLAFFGPWNAKTASMQMGESVNSALQAGGHKFASASMSGNVANLTGIAPNAAAADGAFTAAQNAECEKCKGKDKRWHVVTNNMTVKKAPVIPTQSPYTFDATRSEDGRVVLNGYVRDEAEKAKVLAEANRLFPGNVTDRTIKIALGEPNTEWPNVINANLKDLSILEEGEFNMKDNATFITGRAADVATRDKLNEMVGNLPSGYNGAANISVPDEAAVNIGEVTDQGICQKLFDSLKGDTKINFASARAEIRGKPSFDLLNTLASAANQCASFRIQVDGHTDSQGDDAYNQRLSERRAQTVVFYLSKEGKVDSDRISSTGYGETKPVASNDNATGMAANRRIEFTVTQAE